MIGEYMIGASKTKQHADLTRQRQVENCYILGLGFLHLPATWQHLSPELFVQRASWKLLTADRQG